jgi:hypothetical protein
MYRFQIVTKTEEEAERFMEEINAEDVSIEDWSGSRPGKEYENYVCSFGLTQLTPNKLNRMSDVLGVALIYVDQDD